MILHPVSCMYVCKKVERDAHEDPKEMHTNATERATLLLHGNAGTHLLLLC